MSAEKELVTIPPKETALTLFSSEKGLEPWLQIVRTEIDNFQKVLPELTSNKGRQAYISMAHKVAKSKTALEAVGKQLSAEQKEIPKKIDAERKRVWDTLELWQKEVRKPLDDWQAKEDQRVDYHQRMIRHIEDCGVGLIGGEPQSFAVLFRELEEKIIVDEKFEEFEAEAHRAKVAALAKLRTAFDESQKREAEKAELERLRAEAEARAKADHEAAIARAAAEQVRQEAAAAAQAERDAAAAREQALIDKAAADKRAAEQAIRDAETHAENQRLQIQLQAEQSARAAEQAEANRIAAEQRAERERIAAEQRQADAVERARLAEIARANAAADEINRLAAAREADKAHKMKINRAALDAFIAGGMPEDCAKQAVILIAQRKIPSVSISY